MAPINVSVKKNPNDAGFFLSHDALQGYFRVEGLGFSVSVMKTKLTPPQINAIANTIKIIAEPFMICSLYRQSIC